MSSKSPEPESTRGSKRKGSRSVSSLTPAQLARKRANDREAQRAIRARTKDHIERLERELEQYKNRHSRDQEIQELKRRNAALVMELERLRALVALQPTSSYPPSGYDLDALPPNAGSAVPSRASSFGNGASDYGTNGTTTPGFGHPSYLPTPEPCEAWPVTVSAISVPSVASSPGSSMGHTDDYIPGVYGPTSNPASMMNTSVLQGSNMSCLEVQPKAELEDMDATTPPDHRMPHSSSAAYLSQAPWMYSSYPYSNSPTM